MRKFIPFLLIGALFAQGCVVRARVRGPRPPRPPRTRVIIHGSTISPFTPVDDRSKGTIRYTAYVFNQFC